MITPRFPFPVEEILRHPDIASGELEAKLRWMELDLERLGRAIGASAATAISGFVMIALFSIFGLWHTKMGWMPTVANLTGFAVSMAFRYWPMRWLARGRRVIKPGAKTS